MTESEKFDTAMEKILGVSKQELQKRLDAEKAAKAASSIATSDGVMARHSFFFPAYLRTTASDVPASGAGEDH